MYVFSFFIFFSFFPVGFQTSFPFNFTGGLNLEVQTLSAGNTINIQIGTPTQYFLALFYPTFRDLIVVDVDCGITTKDCPRYCQDPNFLIIYCKPTCQQLTSQSKVVNCLSPFYYLTQYNRTASNSSVEFGDRGEWRAQLPYTHLLAADHVQDVWYPIAGVLDSIPDFQFLSGLIMDSTVLYIKNALIGLAPGSERDPNFVSRLHRKGQLDEPVVSFSTLQADQYHLFYGKGVLGLENYFDCDRWVHFSTLEENAWVFEVVEVEVMGVRMGRTRVMWNTADPYTNMPQAALDVFVQNKVIKVNSRGDLSIRCNETRGYVRLTDSQGQTLTLNHEDLFDYSASYSFFCQAYIRVSDTIRYSSAPEWSIGAQAAMHSCQTFDFGKRKLGIGWKTSGNKQKL